MTDVDVAVIGAGFGGLGAALQLAERGARVAIFERLTYPGGCASTFERHGWQFESGATLFAGLDSEQLFGRWIEAHAIDVEIDFLDPVVEMRSDPLTLDVPADRTAFVDRVAADPNLDESSLRRFFDDQKAIADTLWELFRSPELLPPFGVSEFLSHLGSVGDYLRIAPLMGRSLGSVLASYGLGEPLETYFDAVCQITVQTDADRAEAPFALAATDYFFRGAGHVVGGIGELARGLADTIEQLGGEVLFAEPAVSLEHRPGGWVVEGRRRSRSARAVVAGILPGALSQLLPSSTDTADLDRLNESVRTGWGAAMLYLGIEPDAALPDDPCHLQLIDDADEPLREGNHVFCSVSGRGETGRSPNGERTVTCSTHVDMERYLGETGDDPGDYIDAIHERMRETIRRRAPEIAEAVTFEMTASPRTFERFTGRPDGFVGGIPRTAGLSNYTGFLPAEVAPSLYLVGDSVFPGQSTLATAVGGINVADRVATHLGLATRREPLRAGG